MGGRSGEEKLIKDSCGSLGTFSQIAALTTCYEWQVNSNYLSMLKYSLGIQLTFYAEISILS